MLRYNKLISLILALSIIISTVPSVFAEELPGEPDKIIFSDPRDGVDEEARQKEYSDKLDALQRQHEASILPEEEFENIHKDERTNNLSANDNAFLQLPENKTVLLEDQSAVQPYDVIPNKPANMQDFMFYGANNPHYIKNEHESVSMYWGTMGYFYNIVNMPGKNGLDLSINLVNEMSLAGSGVPDDYNRDRTIAYGWTVDMPHVSLKYIKDDKDANAGGDTCYLFKLYDGKSYLATYKLGSEYLRFVDDHRVNNNLVEIPVSDITIKRIMSGSNTVGFEVTCQDGRKEVYKWGDNLSYDRGQLTKVTDRFGNTINYTYEHVLSPKADLIKKITDSAGREIEFTYATSGYSITSVDIDVKIDTSIKRYATLNINNNFLNSIIDVENKETTFKYESYSKKIYHNDANRTPVIGVTPTVWHYLDKVEYPSGRITNYTYSAVHSRYRYDYVVNMWAYFDYGYTDSYKINTITESYKDANNNIVIKNRTCYSLGEDEFPIYGGGKSISSSVYTDHYTAVQYKTFTTYDFEKSDKLLKETITDNDRIITQITDYVYNENRQIKDKIYTLKKGSDEKQLYTESWEYLPGKTLVTKLTDKFGNVVEYDYGQNQEEDSLYGIPLSITKKFFEQGVLASTQLTENILTSDMVKLDYTLENFDTDSDGIYDKIMKSKYIYSSGESVPAEKEIYEDGSKIYTEKYEYRFDHRVTALERFYTSHNENFEDVQKHTKQDFKYHNVTGWLQRESNEYSAGDTITTPRYTLSYMYDNYGRVTQTSIPGRLIDNSYTFDAASNLNKVVTSDRDFAEDKTYKTFAYYDGYGRVHRQGEYDADDNEITIDRYEYTRNNLYKKYNTNGGAEVYLYDYYNNVTEIIYQENSYTVYGSNTYVYDYYNNKITSKEGEAYTTVYNDKYGRNVKIEKPINIASDTYVETIGYDCFGNVNLNKDGKNNETEFTYNQLGHLINTTNALSQVTDYKYDIYGNITYMKTPGGSVYTNKYDVMGNLLASTDALDETEKYYYDDSCRLVKRQDKNGNITTTEYKYGRNLPETVTTNNTSVSYEYDAYDNITSMTDSEGVTTYGYYPNNRLEKITVPDGKYISYTYNTAGQVTTVRDYNGETTTYQYDGMNRVAYQDGHLHDYWYAKLTPLYVYYDDYRVASIDDDGGFPWLTVVTSPDQSIGYSGSSYIYDTAGNPVEKSESMKGKVFVTSHYQYDELNRLTKETQKKPDSGNVITYTSEYTFDENNNILTQTTTHPGDGYTFDFKQNGSDYSINNITMHNTLYNYDANNRLLNKREIVGGTGSYTGQIEKVTNFTYDKNGNTVKKDIGGQVDRNVVEYVYNPLNHLKEVKSDGITVGAYTYSGNGLRRSRTANGTITKYYWDGQNVVNEAVNGEITATNKYGIHGLYHRSGVGDIMRNKHGDVIGVVSEGTVTHHYRYDAYGNQKTSNENDTNPLRYCGEYYDDESGLIYLRNRYYDPDLGRFINEDPIKSGANWYMYCGGNPVVFIDPFGLDSVIFHTKGMRDDKELQKRQEYYMNEHGTHCHLIEVDSADDFVIEWNKIFKSFNTFGITVDAIEIISHGSATGPIGKDSGGTAYATGYLYFNDSSTNQKNRLYARSVDGMASSDRTVGDLMSVTAKVLNINGCNSANPDIYNIVFGFMQQGSYSEITGWDGGSRYDSDKGDNVPGGGEYLWNGEGKGIIPPSYYVQLYQATWWKYVGKNIYGEPVREREGRRPF